MCCPPGSGAVHTDGPETPVSDITPALGTATYKGTNTAIGTLTDGKNVTNLMASPTITANFGAMTTSGVIPYTNVTTGDAGPTFQWNNVPIVGSRYAGAGSTDTGMTGTVQAKFVGAGAAATTGTLAATGNGSSLVGSFAANKQ